MPGPLGEMHNDPLGTVRRCECGRTWVAVESPPGHVGVAWRREGRIERWRRERRVRKSDHWPEPDLRGGPITSQVPTGPAPGARPVTAQREESEHG